MSRFDEAMSIGNEALLHDTGDAVEYWPGGEEDDARDIDVIWTGLNRNEASDPKRMGTSESAQAEVQVWADDDRGIANPDLKLDVLSRGGQSWRVMGVVETVGGMHRLVVERVNRATVGSARGRR